MPALPNRYLPLGMPVVRVLMGTCRDEPVAPSERCLRSQVGWLSSLRPLLWSSSSYFCRFLHLLFERKTMTMKWKKNKEMGIKVYSAEPGTVLQTNAGLMITQGCWFKSQLGQCPLFVLLVPEKNITNWWCCLLKYDHLYVHSTIKRGTLWLTVSYSNIISYKFRDILPTKKPWPIYIYIFWNLEPFPMIGSLACKQN